MKEKISEVLQKYIDEEELAQAVLLVYQGKEMVYRGFYGYSDIKAKSPVRENSLFRLMSMSKVVTALCVLKLIEEGKLGLDDPLEKYLPQFQNRRVALPGQYEYTPEKPLKMASYLLSFSMDKVKSVPAERALTIRDLLSHSSGIEQGMIGILSLLKNRDLRLSSLKECVDRYASYVLDFQPGSDTNYSPIAGFNILGYLVEVVSGMSLEAFMKEKITGPLEMKDTTFFPGEEQRRRLVRAYKRKDKKLLDVTGTKEDLYGVLKMKDYAYEAGAGGLYSTADDYEHLARMLLEKGVYNGNRVFEEETIELLQTPGAYQYLEKDPGLTWGLGVKIRMDPEKADSPASPGTYGWSGAFGTHFFVSPKDDLEAVFMTNRSDLDGASSYISKRIEELVFEEWKRS